MQDIETERTTQTSSLAKKGFNLHLSVYCAVNALLIVINFTSTSEHLWFFWPLFCWGIGIIFHAIAVFSLNRGSHQASGGL